MTAAILLLIEGQEAELSGSQLGNVSERVGVIAAIWEINCSKGSSKQWPPTIFSIAIIFLLDYLTAVFTKRKATKWLEAFCWVPELSKGIVPQQTSLTNGALLQKKICFLKTDNKYPSYHCGWEVKTSLKGALCSAFAVFLLFRIRKYWCFCWITAEHLTVQKY